MMSEFVYIRVTFNTLLIDKVIKQQHSCLRLRACIDAEGGHFELKI